AVDAVVGAGDRALARSLRAGLDAGRARDAARTFAVAAHLGRARVGRVAHAPAGPALVADVALNRLVLLRHTRARGVAVVVGRAVRLRGAARLAGARGARVHRAGLGLGGAAAHPVAEEAGDRRLVVAEDVAAGLLHRGELASLVAVALAD